MEHQESSAGEDVSSTIEAGKAKQNISIYRYIIRNSYLEKMLYLIKVSEKS